MLVDPFSHFPPDACRTIKMRHGDVLFRQRQSASGMYFVTSGCVTLQRTSSEGDTLTLHRATQGGYFAEASIFSDIYHCDAICTETGTAVEFAKDMVIAKMRSDPAFCESLTQLLAVQVQNYRSHIAIVAIRSAKDRVLAAVQAGYFTSTVTELATRINLTHEACYRALRVLCEDGRLIQIGRGRYALT